MDRSIMFPCEIIQPELFARNWNWPELSGVRKRERHDIRLRLKLRRCWWILLPTVTLVNAQSLWNQINDTTWNFWWSTRHIFYWTIVSLHPFLFAKGISITFQFPPHGFISFQELILTYLLVPLAKLCRAYVGLSQMHQTSLWVILIIANQHSRWKTFISMLVVKCDLPSALFSATVLWRVHINPTPELRLVHRCLFGSHLQTSPEES